jgi:hypothetical protein
MLNWNELKTVATKMANNPNLPIFENFDGEEGITPATEMMSPEAKSLNDYIVSQLQRDDPALGYDTDSVHGRSDIGKNINRAQEFGVPKEPGFMDKLKDYMPSIGIGAGAGAIAGIPVALLINALTGDSKKKDLRSYLKASLLGALIGGGVGAGGGALYRGITGLNIGESRMSETPLGLHNRVYKPIMDDIKSFGIASKRPKAKKKDRTGADDAVSKKELKERQNLRGFE